MFETTEVPGVILVKPEVHRDARGFFVETYREPLYRENGIPERFVQDNHSRSARGTLRGLHAQSPNPQGKLVRCVEGAVWDVSVDVRLGSSSFGRHVAAELTAENFHQLYVPPGFLHGFVVLTEVAQVEYKCTAAYDPTADFGVRWNDPELSIPWPIETPLLSDKDRRAPLLSEVRDRLVTVPG
ncbi:MAG: dTDP-4-dehydrorhamnose 3,5-epimerase [Myxococcota bacterium]|mgnify:CR=1 FL=1|jgi:dTDP-4-dehydrorhamnose 3,5-epimerase|nr:dTDP-4-dehydrorhamnose 3,5-epimerase [Deltaproteobacteria bacterium]MCP4240039.1 dTDP-4-dehydrorhamnose 3,5-epimerase [bacterium]MDP6075049.1 dTDP-4-dehydrorhamnose 3,5-epimerase [Myxococcota bacterium]MDP6243308.1 dTDP-4-dehydrorhamnose 3,5-epimerase [Myxococcota bacterium]MDP7076192.1 dTDP-4-dehydrorhamnose 3,5-epimerase [Myxococcota bacterium]